MIGHRPEDMTLYTLNAEVAPGWRIREIDADRVVIEDGDLRRTLAFDWSRDRGGSVVGSAVGSESAPADSEFQPNRGIAYALIGEAADDTPMPGVRVFSGRNRAAFARLGLRAGDVVTEVNGVGISGDAAELSQALSDTDAGATLRVYRSGRSQEIAIPPRAEE